MTEVFADPLGGLDDARWDEMAGDRFYSTAFWLRLCTFEGGIRSGGVHVDLPDGGRAAVPVIDVGDDPHPNCEWGTMLADRGLPSPPAHGLMVGQLRGYLAHLLATPDADPVTVAGTLLDALRATAETSVGLYLTTPDVLALRAAGLRSEPVVLSADAWIEIPEGGWEAYLSALSGHRAQRIRREIRRFTEAGYRIEQRPLREAYEDVGRLTVHTMRRYGQPADVELFTEAFRKQGEWAGDIAQVLTCSYDDGPAVGCCLYYRHRDTVYLRAVGFDYDRLRGAAEYFNLTYYVPAQIPGVRRLHAGIATPEGKALRGARLRPLWLVDFSRDSVLERAAVRAHNRAFRDNLAAGSPALATALGTNEWETLF